MRTSGRRRRTCWRKGAALINQQTGHESFIYLVACLTNRIMCKIPVNGYLTANMKGDHLASSTRESGNFIQAVNAHYSELGDALHQSNAAKPKKLGPVDLDLLRFWED